MHEREKATEKRRKADANPAGKAAAEPLAAALQPREETGSGRPGRHHQSLRFSSCARVVFAAADGKPAGQPRDKMGSEVKRSRAQAQQRGGTVPITSLLLPVPQSSLPRQAPAFPLLGAGRLRLRPDPRRVRTVSMHPPASIPRRGVTDRSSGFWWGLEGFW